MSEEKTIKEIKDKPPIPVTYNGHRLVKISLPEDVFDVPDAFIMRRKRVPVWRVDELRNSSSSEEVYERLAEMIPFWSGVVDCETLKELGHPIDDPAVFGQIDNKEQLPWLSAQLSARTDPNASTSGRGQK